MALELIVGPPNSGRSGEVLRSLRGAPGPRAASRSFRPATTSRDSSATSAPGAHPALGRDDQDLRRRLLRHRDAAARSRRRRASPRPSGSRWCGPRSAQRTCGSSAAHRARPGFAPALDSLIAELQAALVSPADPRCEPPRRRQATQSLELELAALYEEYESLRDGAGMSDAGSVAAAGDEGASRRPGRLGRASGPHLRIRRPHGVQLELVLDPRRALRGHPRRELRGPRGAGRAGPPASTRLREEGAAAERAPELQRGYTTSASLGPPRRIPVRGRARHRRARRWDTLHRGRRRAGRSRGGRNRDRAPDLGGHRPGRDRRRPAKPLADGPLFASVFRGLGIPVTLEAQLPARPAPPSAARSWRSAGRPARAGEPTDLLAHLRADTASHPGKADWAERARGPRRYRERRAISRSAGKTRCRRISRGSARRRSGVDAGPSRGRGGTARRRVRSTARRAPLAGERSRGVPLDRSSCGQRVTAAELLEELAAVASLPGCAAPTLPTRPRRSSRRACARGSARPRDGYASSARTAPARRGAGTSSCCAMQEGVFPGRGALDPLLGEESRKRLGIPPLRRREQDQEERYLFHVCVSRPTETLTLSWRSCDDEGHPAAALAVRRRGDRPARRGRRRRSSRRSPRSAA